MIDKARALAAAGKGCREIRHETGLSNYILNFILRADVIEQRIARESERERRQTIAASRRRKQRENA